MKKNLRFLLIAILGLSILLVACAPERDEEAGSEGDSSGEAAEKPDELVIWVNDQEEQIEAIENITQKFEEQEGIQVKLETKSMLDQMQELSLAGPEGNGPDLFFQPHDRIGNIVAQGLAEPVDLTHEQLNEYVDTAVEAVTYTYDGNTNIYGIPAVIETYGIFYNKALQEEAPETIEDLLTVLEENSNPSEDQFGFLMRPNDLYFNFPFFKNYGAYIFGGDTGNYDIEDIGLANEGAIEGAELYQSFFGEGKIPTSTTGDVIDGLFTEGKVGSVISGPWSVPGYKEALGEDLGFAPFPMINDQPTETFVGVKSWMVSYYSENKEWAKDLAVFMTNEENQGEYFEIAGELPPNAKALSNIEDPIYAAFAEQIEHGFPMPSAPEMAQVWEPMNNALQFLAEGEDPKTVLEEALEQVQTNIDASGGSN
ncbi:sugar ABC transporter substrate-binding protein [Oceanobacillus kimchii]|uniref:sugar ABC transporter substrate-binding protein n=1 Tax=Oceanobacillus kimchii TaxID=746691 RepID=UPI00232F271D|nr:extracellular solute-binding protein [Oceanobacillus kimchii]